mgnify:FL=1
MNKREAKILALETFANNVEILIESVDMSNVARTPKDCDLINATFDELAMSLRERADRLRSNKKNK